MTLVVGKRVRPLDWERRTGGEDAYAGDIPFEGLLIGRILRSPHPHAEIAHLDTTRARSLPGVHAVVTAADFAAEGFFFQMGMPPIRVDLLMGIPGMAFEDAWQRRVDVDFDGLRVSFISREDLITVKRASGRPQDLIDAELLSQSLRE